MGYKEERWSYFVIGFLLYLYICFNHARFSNHTVNEDLKFYTICFVIYVLGYIIRVVIRNESIYSYCNMYLEGDDYERCLSYISDKENKYPKTINIKLLKLKTLLMLCKIDEYDDYLNKLKNEKKYKRKSVQQTIQNMNYIKQYLIMGECAEVPKDIKSIKGGSLEKTARLIYKKSLDTNPEKAMKLAMKISGDKVNFYKSLGLLIRAELYNDVNDINNRNAYIEKSKSFSPNERMTAYIQMHEELMKI